MTDLSTSCGMQHELLDQLAQQFLSQWRNGEKPDIEQYALSYPEIASDIRDLFPAVVFAEQLHAEATNRSLPNPIHQAMQLGPFHLQREIGSGGMGIVYEATQSPFTQKFAVKVLKQKTIKSSMLESRFAREAQAASRLHHPNIVPAKYYGTEANQHYLVMPLIDGISLDKLLSASASVDTKLLLVFKDICNDWQRIAGLGAQVASALAHAHSHGMIHRDIKPANLILDLEGKIWVTDFGLAKLCDEESDLSRTGELIGTPRYMAPEQILGIADERSDIYSVGLTLYEIVNRISGCNSSVVSDAENTLAQRRRSQGENLTPLLGLPDIRELNPKVPKRLAAVIMKACAHSPRARYQDARELELALNELSHSARADRRRSPSSRAIDNKAQARNVAVLFGVFLIFAVTFYVRKPTYETDLAIRLASSTGTSSAANGALPLRMPEHNQYIHPLTHCIIYDEPGKDLVNVLTRVNSSADDAEELENGEVILVDSELDLTGNGSDQIVGLRFAGVEVAPGTQIHSAKLYFNAELDGELATALRIFGVNESNPKSFDKLNGDISRRERTEHFVSWSPGHWTSYNLYESSECKAIVQSIIDNPDWRLGNAIAFVIDGNGNRTVTTYDENRHVAPYLMIQFKSKSD